VPFSRNVSCPVRNGISKWVYRDICQSVCPFNIKFAQEFKVPEFSPREVLAGKDARALGESAARNDARGVQRGIQRFADEAREVARTQAQCDGGARERW
jgi:epoxyqueuosine reductase QueG